jgi:asparagine synthase (glutamine-hydrolysing)
MCGLAGWLGPIPNPKQQSQRMAHALRHRGPDDSAVATLQNATLVHTRLSIIDLTDSGRQPMSNEDGTVWVVFNGEIYNHRELRRVLEQRGHRFRGHSDSEILPHLYEEEGTAFLDKLRGMFALAIYDSRSRALVVARDRFGIKPLFYAQTDDCFAFASELNALLDFPGVDRSPDRQAVADFSALLYIPAPQTFYAGMRSLQPGEFIEAHYRNDCVTTQSRNYFQWCIRVDPDIQIEEAAAKTEHLVTQAVRRQLESDVPLGSLLSGGIDSSLVSRAAQCELGNLKTFNVRFPDANYDETWAATAVARHIKSHHETLDIMDGRGTWESVTSLLLHAGQPFADTSLFAVNAISRLMRQHVAVALSGDGGDEAFGGYSTFWQLERIARFRRCPPLLRQGAYALLGSLSGLGLLSPRLPRRVKELSDRDETSMMQSLFCWLGEEEHRTLRHDDTALPVRRWFCRQWEHELPSGSSRIEHLSAYATELYIRLSMANDFLFKVDIGSMRESLEVRVPMLDEDLFAFGLTLPHSCKVERRSPKKVLRTVAERWLPQSVARKPKWGFAIPLDSWVDDDFKRQLYETVLGRSSRLDEFFKPEVYRSILEAFCTGRGDPGISRQGLYQRAIMLLSLHLHLDRARSTCSSSDETETAPVFQLTVNQRA